jgi:hypothetical protein
MRAKSFLKKYLLNSVLIEVLFLDKRGIGYTD